MHKAAQIPDTFIDYEKLDEMHVFKLLVFFGIHPSKARLNIAQTQQVIKEQNLHPKKLAINNFHDFANVKKFKKNHGYYFISNKTDLSKHTDEPIIVLYDKGNYRVIDGNHRVHEKLLENDNTASAYVIDGEFLLKNDLFITDYDQQLFECENIYFKAI